MMNWINILAARGDGDADWVRIILIVVALAIGLIVKVIKTAIEKAQRPQPQRPQDEEPVQEPPLVQHPQAQAPERPWQQQPSPRPHPPAQPAPRMHAPPASPLQARREQTLKEQVVAKTQRMQERVRRAIPTLEQMQEAARARSGGRTRQTDREPPAPPPVKVVVRTVADARAAILYSEIIAPCKALRQAPEMWD